MTFLNFPKTSSLLILIKLIKEIMWSMFNRDGWIEKEIRPHFDVQMGIAGGEKNNSSTRIKFPSLSSSFNYI